MSIPPYPLQWPSTLPRTSKKASSQFRSKLSAAMNNVQDSLRRFATDSGQNVGDVVISSNVTLGVNNPQDTGVAVWFVWDDMQVCIAVDRYPKVEDNLQAIHHVIEARRTEVRHGGLHIARATFKGFQALPSPDGVNKRTWRQVFGLAPDDEITRDELDRLYRAEAKKRHPDQPQGSHALMTELNDAKSEAMREIG
ncbi:MAG: molecular chaperone DnaJ [Rhizobiales bacterium]|nr:molecular chaperone DnaJ [Hoeflea sp.]MBG19366.1 molecular chaperone DnaJ [Hyphomicrobiales bacterium]|tara:strand:+ start:2870 stop:3457 length:588 start_codon:yes stop_codon:yes gene_type:complete